MLEQLTRLARHSAVYGLGGIVSRLLAVLLLPLYTSYLTPGDYGRVETLIALTAVIVTFVRGAIFRFAAARTTRRSTRGLQPAK